MTMLVMLVEIFCIVIEIILVFPVCSEYFPDDVLSTEHMVTT